MSLPEKKMIGQKQNRVSKQRKQTRIPANPRMMRKIISVNMVHSRSNKDQKIEEKLANQKNVPVTESDLKTPVQSIYIMKQKTTESTAMPNLEEQTTKTIEFSPIGNGDEITINTGNKQNNIHHGEVGGDRRNETEREEGGDNSNEKALL